MQPTILVVDDEESIRLNFEAFMLEKGYAVLTAATYPAAMKIIADTPLDVIIVDILLKGYSGIDMLHEAKRLQPFCPVIIITGAPDLDTATEAVRLGAFDYLIKPVRRTGLLKAVAQALQRKSLEDQNDRYRRNLEAILKSLSDAIITVDDDMVVTEANQAVFEICGFKPQTIVNLPINRLPYDCNRSCITQMKRVLESGEPVDDLQLNCRHRRSPNQTVVVNCSPLYDYRHRSLGAIMAVRDVTRLTVLEKELKERYRFANIIGKSPAMQDVFQRIEDLSDVDTTVLITGESGTGKELIGKAIHYAGVRKDKPLITVNCSALAEELLESELFGHVKGAFTGATSDRTGRFQMAHRGTLFLDEIGDVSPRIQQRLLRVLQEKAFERVGDSKPLKVDVRILAATNTDLKQCVHQGRFRADLYYRLNVVEIHLPPLRDRREDIPLLTAQICRRLKHRLKKDIDHVSDEVMDAFMAYAWPGNIRELENALEHAFILCRGAAIGKQHLPTDIRDNLPGYAPLSSHTPGAAGDERSIILNVLTQTDWNKAKAARILGISRPTLYSKIQTYRLHAPRSRF